MCAVWMYRRHKRLCSIAVTKDAPAIACALPHLFYKALHVGLARVGGGKKNQTKITLSVYNIDRNLPGPISPLFVSNA